MANINKVSVNGEVYDINPAWVSVTDEGIVLNADKFGELQEIKREFDKKR